MKKSSKGVPVFGKLINSRLYFSDEEKHYVIYDLIATKSTESSIWRKYTGKEDGQGKLLKLKKRILAIEQQLKDAETRIISYSTMVDIAEKEFNISIKKSTPPNHLENENYFISHRISQIM